MGALGALEPPGIAVPVMRSSACRLLDCAVAETGIKATSANAARPRPMNRKALVVVVMCVSSLDLFLPSAAARFVEDAGHGFFAMTCPKGKRCENARPVPISPHERTGTCPTLRQFGRKRSLCAPAGGLELRAATTDTASAARIETRFAESASLDGAACRL